MAEKIIAIIQTRIDVYRDIIDHDWLSHDDTVLMQARLSELEELLDKIERLNEES